VPQRGEPCSLLRRFNVKGKSAHDGPISGSVSTNIVKDHFRISHINGHGKIEGKYSDKATGNAPFRVS